MQQKADLFNDSSSDLIFAPGEKTSVRPEFLHAISSLTENQLRSMAAEGYFPAPIKRRFNLTATIRGIITCLQARIQRRSTIADFASMDAVEGAGLFTKKFLQTLKNAGCPGFHASGRVDITLLLPGIEAWLSGDNHKDKLELQREGVANWGVMREKYLAMNEKLKHGELDRRLIEFAVAVQVQVDAEAVFFSQIERIALDAPGQHAGRTTAQIKDHMRRWADGARRAVKKQFETQRTQSLQQLEQLNQQPELAQT